MRIGEKIKLTKKVIQQCEDFAEARIGGSEDEYKRRGEKRNTKIYEDILLGAAGEFAAYKYLSSCGVRVNKPDLAIYDVKNKSFDADLVSNKYTFHVKSQGEQSRKRYGCSWLLQRRDKVVSDPDEFEYFIFCSVELPYVEILGVVKCKDISDNNLYGECRVPSYRNTKVALYLDELMDLDLERF